MGYVGDCAALCRTMKKEKKYYIDNLTCFVTRMRASGGVDSIRSFALSNQQPQLTTSAAPTPFNTQSTSYLSAIPSFSKTSSSNDSLRGSSVSSTTFNHDLKEHNDRMGPPTKRDSIGLSSSSGTSTSSLSFDALSCDDLFSINHEAASERDVFEPLATMALNSKSNPDDPKHSAPGLSSHSKGSGAQVDDTPKNSRPSSPRKSKRKELFLPPFAHSHSLQKDIPTLMPCHALFASHENELANRNRILYRSVAYSNAISFVFATRGVKIDCLVLV